MATISDRLVGMAVMFVAVMVMCYYSAWVIVLPFVDEDNLAQKFFLPWWWAVVLPTTLLLILIVFIGTFVGVVVLKNSRPR
ncbi:Dolichol phosphate-mannose biosynthesis regulatory protein [Geodia barretti]|uniref:Dolichol phosphate-mannose biosynthesis regulatory protein n=1 Tax=Geodia barretti TaxID=519541 RepID=A0AA35R4I8_GEOBA|nr:Dolichol phosphate-mannose biosynthesis regulatory protein [Geodia barretti]